jgi:hypothetical protein
MRPGQVKLGRFQFGQSIIYNLELSVPAVGNINKLSLMVGMQLPEKYKENFDVSSEGPSLVTPDDIIY